MSTQDVRVATPVWRDAAVPTSERVSALISEMTLEEKVSQLVGLWVGADASGGDVAPHQGDMTKGGRTFDQVIVKGLGQLTRPFGTAPVEPHLGAQSLASSQRKIMEASRFAIPAQVHEECLAGFAAWKATAYPVPLSWGASFNPALIEQMSRQIARAMKSVGIHQGLAPVLDVTRDYRWGRVEETIGEDPYLVGTVGASYVKGLEQEGIVATLKHFAGYSGSKAARNHAPVEAGPRLMADIYYPPFEMALRTGGARSVMNSYAEVDGVPAGANRQLLTELLRNEWGFAGTVVADYFAVAFLRTQQRVAASDGEAAALALTAGIDVELPSVYCYDEPLMAEIAAGRLDESVIDTALQRVLQQKIELGLLDDDYQPETGAEIDFNPADAQQTALEIARQAVILLDNSGAALPLAPASRVAVVGPLAEDPYAMLGCYSFPAHVGVLHPESEIGLDIPTFYAELARQHTGAVSYAPGCDVKQPGQEGFAAAQRVAQDADVVVVFCGDQAGLFGRGTSGEGCDAADLNLPGEQAALVEAMLETGKPVVLVVCSGRPYALGQFGDRLAATVQTFFPGQHGAEAMAEVLTGARNPSGHLPVGIPRDPGVSPATYLAPPLGKRSGVSNLDPEALYPFGHGTSYQELNWGAAELVSGPTWDTNSEAVVRVTLHNPHELPVADVVQLYLHDPVAQVSRPESRLVAYQRVELAAGTQASVELRLHADLTSFTGLGYQRIVEPGALELRVAKSSTEIHARLEVELTGPLRTVDHTRTLVAQGSVQVTS